MKLGTPISNIRFAVGKDLGYPVTGPEGLEGGWDDLICTSGLGRIFCSHVDNVIV